MINDRNLNQEGGEKSTNFQGQTVNVYNGISYTDAKEIALDVFKSNFIHLKNEAAQIAAERAEEITEKVLSRVNQQSPDSMEAFKQPAMQDALFTAQKEYAKSGDKDVSDLLVDIVVERANVKERSMLQIVLDESLQIATKLTVEQLDILTLSFLLTRTKRLNLSSFTDFKHYIITTILPFVENIEAGREQFRYLEYLRCGSIRMGQWDEIQTIFRKYYKAILSRGFTMDEFYEAFGNESTLSGLLGESFFDANKFQFLHLSNEQILEGLAKVPGLIDKPKLEKFLTTTSLNVKEVSGVIEAIHPNIHKLIYMYNTSGFRTFELSQVGIAIAHANYRRRTGETMNLSIWIK